MSIGSNNWAPAGDSVISVDLLSEDEFPSMITESADCSAIPVFLNGECLFHDILINDSDSIILFHSFFSRHCGKGELKYSTNVSMIIDYYNY